MPFAGLGKKKKKKEKGNFSETKCDYKLFYNYMAMKYAFYPYQITN